MSDQFDVVIVGARCAGASLATRLADAGGSVLVLDADRLPSDMAMSTHFVQPSGMDVLDELGVGDRVRALAPASTRLRVDLDGSGMTARFAENRAGYRIRRIHLDSFLQERAVAAGAELRDQSKVTGLLRDGERVTGVRVRGKHGDYEVNAKLVVGADGFNSTIARLTGVEQYLDFDMTRGGYWFYWDKPALWDTDAYPYDALIHHQGDELLCMFQCDGDKLLIVVAPPQERVRAWGAAYRQHYLEWLRRCPVTAPLVEGREPEGRGMGLLKAHFFYRRPVGPGFALVGDAGNFKDFVTGQGITDALLHSRDLAAAILDGREGAMEWYWRHRDVMSLPLYQDARKQGAVGYNNAFNRMVLGRMGQTPELAERALLMTDRKLAPSEVLPFRTLLGWLAKDALRGRFDALRSFPEVGKQVSADQAELRNRVAKLAAAEAALGGAPKPVRLTASGKAAPRTGKVAAGAIPFAGAVAHGA